MPTRTTRCGGGWDLPLNETGRQQAQVTAQEQSELLATVDLIYVSPMVRALRTAELLTKGLEKKLHVQEAIREWRIGDWEAKLWRETPKPFDTNEDPPNGETRLAFEERVIGVAASCLQAARGRSTLFVSHGAVAHTLLTYLAIDVPYIENAKIYKIYPVDQHWHLSERLQRL